MIGTALTTPNDMRIVVIPPKAREETRQTDRRLKVAAYCRVSTDQEEQESSYEAQISYYTEKINGNSEWQMAGIFADEGITGTQAKKRPKFLKMIRKCRERKIDIILTKSLSRFARNTVDSLKYIRDLKALGIAIVFEKENINTLETDTEMMLTIMSCFARYSIKFCVNTNPIRQGVACEASMIWDFLLIAWFPWAETVCAPQA